jgi:anti-sigma factor RsiW
MKNHPPIEILSASIDGSLSDPGLSDVRDHVRLCDPCRRDLDGLRSARASLRSLATLSAPRDLMAALRQEFVPPAVAPARRWRWLRVAAPAFATLAVAAGFWFTRQPAEPELALESLLAAHSRYQAESLVPPADMYDANFSGHLASYYANEN